MTKDVTIKTGCFCIQEHPRINKVFATVDAKNMAKLLDVVGLDANPRKSKWNKITKAIHGTLEHYSDEMRFRSKGLLISTSKCIRKERGRFTLSFEDESYEGVLDGGHNILAIGLFILKEFFGEEYDKQCRNVKNWDSFLDVWKCHQGDIESVLGVFTFEVPIEIIYPTKEYADQFPDSIFAISDARNNNSALTEGTKADHKGYYDILKDALKDDIKNEVEWKDFEGQRIKRDDIVAMSLIPLYALHKAGALKEGSPAINLINLYSAKGKCIDVFSNFCGHYDSDKEIKISDEIFLSAIALMGDLPRLYDLIYKLFPEAYNGHSPGFGRMKKYVKIFEKGKKGDSYLSKPPLTRYYQTECKYKYPDGFIIPIFCGLWSLMEVKGKRLQWKIDPEKFITENLKEGIKMLMSTIRDNDYNPNVVGKNKGAYDGIEIMFEYLLTTQDYSK